jgi:hypothetical protein
MGQIDISIAGSFGPRKAKSFSAMSKGHAHAVAEAIAWLSSEVLPDAIANDHDCHGEGEKPPGGFPQRGDRVVLGGHG